MTRGFSVTWQTRRAEEAAKSLVENNEHIIVLTMDKENYNIRASGDNIWVKALTEGPGFKQLETMLLSELHQNDEKLKFESHPKVKGFPRLFAKPGSKTWKGAGKIRMQLSALLKYLGYSSQHYGKTEAPSGWPTLVDWSKFRGPSRSVSVPLCSEITFQLLEEAGINPMEHGPDKEQEEIPQEFPDEDDLENDNSEEIDPSKRGDTDDTESESEDANNDLDDNKFEDNDKVDPSKDAEDYYGDGKNKDAEDSEDNVKRGRESSGTDDSSEAVSKEAKLKRRKTRDEQIANTINLIQERENQYNPALIRRRENIKEFERLKALSKYSNPQPGSSPSNPVSFETRPGRKTFKCYVCNKAFPTLTKQAAHYQMTDCGDFLQD
jgi:hypothetical protein